MATSQHFYDSSLETKQEVRKRKAARFDGDVMKYMVMNDPQLDHLPRKEKRKILRMARTKARKGHGK